MNSLVKFHLDRNLSVSLTEQIKGQIKYAIAYGQLNAGDPLPSIRDLAEQLEVAPMTISRVYSELAEESLVISKPRSGTYVAELVHLNGAANPSYQSLYQILCTSVRQARLSGYPLDEIKNTFDTVIAECKEPSASRTVILVANFRHTTEHYARSIEEILSGMEIRVVPLIISDLENDLAAYEDLIKKARLTITIATRYNDVRALLEPKYSRVVGVAFQLSRETRKTLAELPPDTRLGIVTTFPEFLQTMLEGVHSFSIVKDPPLCAMLNQAGLIKEMFSKIDVLLYASGSEAVLADLPSHVRAIEFLHEPVPESLNRLRPFLY